MSTWTDQNRLFLSLPANQLVAITAYGEAGNEGGEGMMAVANVIKNRTQYPAQFADSEILSMTGSIWHAVILKYKQFSMYNPGNAVRPIAERIAKNYNAEVSSNAALGQAHNIASLALSGMLADNTNGATYYHATYVQPNWGLPLVAQIGNHLFYTSPTALIASSESVPVSIPEDIIPQETIPSESDGGEEYVTASIGGAPLTWMILIGMGVGMVFELMRRKR